MVKAVLATIVASHFRVDSGLQVVHYLLTLVNNHNLLCIVIDYEITEFYDYFFNLGKYSKCISKPENVLKGKHFSSVQWIVTADKDQTSTWYMGVPPSLYNHAAIYETSGVTLTSVNASNNHNLATGY